MLPKFFQNTDGQYLELFGNTFDFGPIAKPEFFDFSTNFDFNQPMGTEPLNFWSNTAPDNNGNNTINEVNSMALPKLNVPRYELKVPSDGQRIKYRPFLVKKKKLLLLAMESQDQKMMIDTIQTLLENCTNLSKTAIKGLATFDFEYIFLNIRAKSVGESVG